MTRTKRARNSTSAAQRPAGVPARAEIVDHDERHGTPPGTLGRFWTWYVRTGERPSAGVILSLYQGERQVETSTSDGSLKCGKMLNGFRYRAEVRA